MSEKIRLLFRFYLILVFMMHFHRITITFTSLTMSKNTEIFVRLFAGTQHNNSIIEPVNFITYYKRGIFMKFTKLFLHGVLLTAMTMTATSAQATLMLSG